MKKRYVHLFIISVLIFHILFQTTSFSLGSESRNHVIAGFGPIEGTLWRPTLLSYCNDKMFVFDYFGVSIFQMPEKAYLKRINLHFNDSENNSSRAFWKEWFTKEHNNNRVSKILNTPRFILDENRWYYIDMAFDSDGNLYVMGKGEIIVFQVDSWTETKRLPIPTLDIPANPDYGIVYNQLELHKDKIYIDISYVTENEIPSDIICCMDLDGSLVSSIPILCETDEFGYFYQNWTILPELDLFLFIKHGDCVDDRRLKKRCFSFVNFQGEVVFEEYLSLDFIPRLMKYVKPGVLVLITDKDYTEQPTFFLFYEKTQINTYRLQKGDEIQLFEVENVEILDLVADDSAIFLIYQYWPKDYFQSFVCEIQEGTRSYFGTQREENIGQVFGSTAFAVHSDHSLWQTNLSNDAITGFQHVDGETIDQFEIPETLDEGSMFVRDMVIDRYNNFILLSSIPASLYCLDSTLSLSKLVSYREERVSFSVMKLFNDTLYFLDNRSHYPSLFYRDIEYTPDQHPKAFAYLNQIYLQSSEEDFKSNALFLDFAVTEKQYILLDSENSEISVIDRESEDLVQTIPLPKQANSFYTSLSLYPDDTYLLTDVLQCCLLHVDQTGNLLETIGSKGQVEIGTTKEAYLEKPDQFYFPIRAKIANNHIYVSDFGNCRYHVIPIESLSINWNEESVQHENVSIFSSESGSLHYDLSTPSILTYDVTSTVPWLQLPQQSGSLSDKQIDYQILGEKLTPWQTQKGEIRITFPEQWSYLNHTIPVSVYAIGSTVELTIGSIQAKVDGRWIALELGYIPVIKQGRTCIGLRFLTEYLFRSHATIEYEADIQRIKVTTKDHTVYMMINHPVASVDGKSVSLDVPPFIQQGRTMIPLRFVSESLEAEVSWEASTQKVTITYPRSGKKP